VKPGVGRIHFRIAFLLLLCSLLAAQTLSLVSIQDEPHHKLLLENPYVRVFAVTLPRLESTVPTRHDSNYIVIYLGESAVSRTVPGHAPIGSEHYDGEIRLFYPNENVTEHNERGITYRNITVELVGQQGGKYEYNWQSQAYSYPPAIVPPPLISDTTSMQSVDMGGIVASRVQIMPNDSRATESKHNPALLIALTDLELSSGGQTIAKRRGEAEWFTTGMPPTLKNTGSSPCRFAMLQF